MRLEDQLGLSSQDPLLLAQSCHVQKRRRWGLEEGLQDRSQEAQRSPWTAFPGPGQVAVRAQGPTPALPRHPPTWLESVCTLTAFQGTAWPGLYAAFTSTFSPSWGRRPFTTLPTHKPQW